MTPEQFCYWLQGFSEITATTNQAPTSEQWKIINDHLQTVFKKVTPEYKPNLIQDAFKQLEKKVDDEREGFPHRDPWKVTCSDRPQAIC